MSEKKTSLKVPLLDDLKLEDLRLLKHHEGNPNRMTVKQKEQLWHSLQRYGWLVPIITDADGIVADGEQRVDVCIAHGEFLFEKRGHRWAVTKFGFEVWGKSKKEFDEEVKEEGPKYGES